MLKEFNKILLGFVMVSFLVVVFLGIMWVIDNTHIVEYSFITILMICLSYAFGNTILGKTKEENE